MKVYNEMISVIIPLYNAEAYIRQCIKSVCNQTYTNFEIIIVDDGSTDRGQAVCRELKKYDERIHLIVQENKGVSAARNRGLDIASGKYLFFLDSDDAIHPLLFEELIYQAEELQADLALCEHNRQKGILIDKTLNEVSVNDARPRWRMLEKEESNEWIHTKYTSALLGVGILVRRDLTGGQRFDENLIFGEDTLFTYQLVCKGARIAYSTQGWYYYRMHAESAIHSLNTMKNEHYFDVYRILRDEEKKRGHSNFAMIWERRLVWMIRSRYILMKQNGDEEGERIIKEQALREKEHPLFKELSFIPRFLFLCCFFCNPLYYFVLEKLVRGLERIMWGKTTW